MSSIARSRKGRRNQTVNRPKIRRSLIFLKMMIKILMLNKSTLIIRKRMKSLKIG